MSRIQLAVLGSNSKQNAETLKTYTQQNADETPEHGTPAVALTPANAPFGKRLDRRALSHSDAALPE